VIFVCGIYGYQITRPIDLLGLKIEPRTNDHQQAEVWARDPDNYQLTAVLMGTSISDKLLFNLEAILSFVEHLDVLITSPEEQTNDDPFAQFSSILKMHRINNDGGRAIGVDTVFPASRSLFISRALEQLKNKQFCKETRFNDLFFKYVETFRQHRAFADISYFLLYSGLESYARSEHARSEVEDTSTEYPSNPICELCGRELQDKRKELSSSELIYRLLRNYGFDVHQEIKRSSDARKAVATYTHLRNALFHNSKFTVPLNVNGTMIELKLFDYLPNFAQLVALVILKAVDFDDGHINWDSWIDMQPFK
jgi:hypothetical protein